MSFFHFMYTFVEVMMRFLWSMSVAFLSLAYILLFFMLHSCLEVKIPWSVCHMFLFIWDIHINTHKTSNITFSKMLCLLSYPTHCVPCTKYGTLSFCSMCSVKWFALINLQIWKLNKLLIERTLGECILIYQIYQARLWERVLNRLANLAIRHAFSNLSLVNLISKETNLVFCLSVHKLIYSLN